MVALAERNRHEVVVLDTGVQFSYVTLMLPQICLIDRPKIGDRVIVYFHVERDQIYGRGIVIAERYNRYYQDDQELFARQLRIKFFEERESESNDEAWINDDTVEKEEFPRTKER